MNQQDAEEYTQALGQVVAGGWRQIALGERLGVPKALGLSVEAWVKERLGGYVKLSVDERRQAAKELKSEGLKQREIAAVLGVSQPQIHEDLTADKNLSSNQRNSAQSTQALDKNLSTAAPLDVVVGLTATNDVRLAAETKAARAAREEQREEKRQQNAAKVATVSDPRELLKVGRFATIVIDPPWDFADEGDVNPYGRAKHDYASMPIDDILLLPVDALADTDCHLYLWITNRSLPKGFRLLEAWGFRHVSCLTWCKPSIGMGQYFRGSTEHVLFGVRGSQPLKRQDVGTWFEAPRGGVKHSSKPEVFFTLVETCSPGPYLEMFGRPNGDRKGWTVWGEQSAR